MAFVDRALAFAWLLEFGLTDPQAVVAWIDAVIEQEATPDNVLLEASLCASDRNSLISTLRTLNRGNPQVTARVVIHEAARILETDESQAKRITSLLYGMALAEVLPGPTAEGEMLRLDDALDLAEQGISGTRDAALEELRAFLACYDPGSAV